MDYYIGIDIGTGGVRTGIFDREGKSVIFCAEPIELSLPHSGWAEHGPGRVVERPVRIMQESYTGKRHCSVSHQGAQR